MTKRRIIGILKYSLGILLGAALLYLAFRGVSFSEVWSKVSHAKFGWIALAMVAGMTSHFIRGVRWRMQLQASGYNPSNLNAFAAVMVGYLVNTAVPRGGEVARCSALFKSDKIPVSTGFGTVVVERVFDMIILMLLIIGAFFLESQTLLGYLGSGEEGGGGLPKWLLIGLPLALILAAGIFWRFRNQIAEIKLYRKLVTFIQDLFRSALSIRNIERPWLYLIYTAAIWILYYVMTYLAVFSLDEVANLDFNLPYLALIVTIMGGIAFAVPAPGGIGAYHAAVKITFETLAVLPTTAASGELGLTFAFLLHTPQIFFMYPLAGIFGYLYLWFREPRDSATVSQLIED